MTTVMTPALLRVRLALWALGLAVVDQGIKWIVNDRLIPEVQNPVIPGIFNLTLTYNTGAAFSLLDKFPALLTGLSALLLLILAGYAFTRQSFKTGEPIALALLMGGALGNLMDRVQSGRVTDFLDVICIHYPIFNGADIFIFFGALILLFCHWGTESAEPGNPTAS